MTSEPTHGSAGKLFALIFAVLAILTLAPGLVQAHAVLVSSSPTQGQRLAAAPSGVRLRFSEPVTHVVLTLSDRFGRARLLAAAVSGPNASAPIAWTVSDGAYALNWSAISDDGHPVRAAVVFSVGRGVEMQDLTHRAAVGRYNLSTLIWAARAGYYVFALFGVGGAFFAFWIGGGPSGRWTAASLSFAIALAGLSLIFFGLDGTGEGLPGLLDIQAWQGAFYGSYAKSVGLLAAALVLSLAAIHRPRYGKWLALAAFIAVGPAFALTGHASDTGLKWLSASVLSFHVAAACFWAGSLPRLWSILGPGKRKCSETLARFSSAIPLSIAPLLIGGLYLAWLELEHFGALWLTAYGKVLLVKVVFVGGAMALGAFNRFRLTRGVLRGDEKASRSMKRIVAAEVLLIALVLSVTSLWRFTPPPRALALQPPTFASVHIHKPMVMATLSFWTRQDLTFDVEVALSDSSFDAFDVKELSMKMSSSDESVAPFSVPLRRKAVGIWRGERIQAPCDCDWKVGVKVLVSDFDMVNLDGKVKLRPDE